VFLPKKSKTVKIRKKKEDVVIITSDEEHVQKSELSDVDDPYPEQSP